MNQSMINQVLLWERRLEIEAEKKKNRRSEPDYFPAAPQPAQWKLILIFERIFRHEKEQPCACPDYSHEPC